MCYVLCVKVSVSVLCAMCQPSSGIKHRQEHETGHFAVVEGPRALEGKHKGGKRNVEGSEKENKPRKRKRKEKEKKTGIPEEETKKRHGKRKEHLGTNNHQRP